MEQEIIERWFGDTTSSTVYVITDNQQYPVITQVLEKMECNSIKFINIDKGSIDYRALEDLQRDDMIIVALSIDSFIYKCNKEKGRSICSKLLITLMYL